MLRNYYAAFIVITVVAGCALAAEPRHGEFIASYNKQALQGDLSKIESEFSKTIHGSYEDDYYQKFRARFIVRSDGFNLDSIEDRLVRGAASLYQNYWRDALLSPKDITEHEATLAVGLVVLLRKHNSTDETLNLDNSFIQLIAAFEDRGYFLLLGRTAPLLEFIVWRNKEVIEYDVELTDMIQPVTVNFLDNFVSLGWINFATIGEDGTGGWANSDGLFAIGNYDRDAEKFLVSYLKHEGRHFADYTIFPNISGGDLEYRAKLTELAFAEGELQHLLRSFTALSEKASNAPHPLANWHVINDLSGALLGGSWPDDHVTWQNLSTETIQHAAKALLDKHTRTLLTDGADTTQGTIRP